MHHTYAYTVSLWVVLFPLFPFTGVQTYYSVYQQTVYTNYAILSNTEHQIHE